MNRMFKITVLAILGITANVFAVDKSINGLRTIPWEAGVFTRIGYDSLQGEVKGYCVKESSMTSENNSNAQVVWFSLTKIENSEKLESELGFSASSSMKFGLGKAKGRMAFAQSIKVNSYSIYVLVKVTVVNAEQTMKDVELKDEVFKMLTDEGPEKFRRRCGDSFVTGYTDGGQLIGMIEIKTKNEQDKQNINASIAGSYGVFKADARFKEAVENISTHNAIDVKLYQEGGDTNSVSIGIDELIKKAIHFPKDVTGSTGRPWIWQGTVTGYDTLRTPVGIEFPDDRLNAFNMDRLNTRLSAYRKSLSDIDYVLENRDQFEAFDSNYIYKIRSDVELDIVSIYNAGFQCTLKNSAGCKVPENLKVDLLSIKYPKRAKRAPVCRVVDYGAKLFHNMGECDSNPGAANRHKGWCGEQGYNEFVESHCWEELEVIHLDSMRIRKRWNKRMDILCANKTVVCE